MSRVLSFDDGPDVYEMSQGVYTLVHDRPRPVRTWTWALDMQAAGWHCWGADSWQRKAGKRYGRFLTLEEIVHHKAAGTVPPAVAEGG